MLIKLVNKECKYKLRTTLYKNHLEIEKKVAVLNRRNHHKRNII